jgi:hypothetical protein
MAYRLRVAHVSSAAPVACAATDPRWMRRLLFPAAALCALASAAPAVAAPAPITGKLTARGYTLIALGANGRATSVRVNGPFRLVPPARKVTLHLRGPKGVYAGPVVAARRGSRVVLGVRAGAKLGTLRLGRGVARTAKAVPARWLDATAWAAALRGVPRGAGRLGLVRSPAVGRTGPGRDQDRDGIPGAFDVDDNGNLVLDNVDRAAGGRARVAQAGAPGADANAFSVFSNFHFDLSETLNANAGGVTDAQIDAAMTRAGSFVGLVFQVPYGSVQLDCGALSYCSAGGTGRTAEPHPDGAPFSGGTIARGPTGDFQLRTFAPATKIGAGDTFIERVGDGASAHELTGVLNYMFNTTPAARSWSDSAGDAGTFAYPVAADAPGTRRNPLPVARDAEGKVKMTFSFWRPQRKAIPGAGEGDGFVDIGGLDYQVNVPNGPQGPGPQPIGAQPARGPQSCALANLSSGDAGLHPLPPFALTDTAADRPADPANTLTVTIDLTGCLAAAGLSLEPGQSLAFELQAKSRVGDNADQGFTICLPQAGQATCAQPAMAPPSPGGPPVGPPSA